MARDPNEAATDKAKRYAYFDEADILLVPKVVGQKKSNLRRRSTISVTTGGPTDDNST